MTCPSKHHTANSLDYCTVGQCDH